MDVLFPAELAGNVQSWLLQLQDQSAEAQKSSPSVRELEKNKLLKKFSRQDNVGHFTTNLPHAEITIGDVTTKADLDGNFSFHGLAVGEHQATISLNGKQLKQVLVKVKKGDNNVELQVLEELDNMFTQMGVEHGIEFDASAPIYGVIPNDGGSTGYYKGIKVGSVFGLNKGTMKMLTADGHVSCNKSDWDNGSSFPWNNSDCSDAIAGGMIYNNNPLYNYKYYAGTMCVTESMSSVFAPSESNVYCNQKVNTGKKPVKEYYRGYLNLGYNCSSFTFLNGDERLNSYNF